MESTPSQSNLAATSPNKAKLDALIARLAAQKAAIAPAARSAGTGAAGLIQNLQATSQEITLDPDQQSFISIATSLPKTAVLVGAAGTGKTTCMNQVTQALMESGKIPPLTGYHKSLPAGAPGIVIVSFTNRAVNNIRKKLPPGLQHNCITIHKLLEYAPKFEEYRNADGEWKTKRVFVPTRNAYNPLSSSIRVIIFEESSMNGLDLYNQVIEAFPDEKPSMIFLGDINQLQPIFTPAILGYKMLEALSAGTFVELRTIHRQAAESPIISFAHQILRGEAPLITERMSIGGAITIRPVLKQVSPDAFIHAASRQLFEKEFAAGTYNPISDMILIPFNKAAGTLELNRYIGTMYAKSRDAEIWEISSGFQKLWLSEGDKVLYGKLDCIITKIQSNAAYVGTPVRPPSRDIDYWGNRLGTEHHLIDSSEDDWTFGESEGTEGRQASHILTLQSLDDPDQEFIVSSCGDVNSLLLSYAITIHKSQGSESRKVYLLLHHSHNVMLTRELLYTGVTRAREELTIMCEIDSLQKGCANQKITGTSVYEKAELFKGKIEKGAFPLW